MPTVEEYAKNYWIGQSVEELKEADSRPSFSDSYASSIGWKKTTYKLDSGNWVYVELVRKDCYVHWEVNPQGIIIGSRVEKTSNPPRHQNKSDLTQTHP